MGRNAVSPTAYATGYFWYQHGLSPEVLATRRGRRLNSAFGLFSRLSETISGISLTALMLARHRGIDALLEHAIADGRITQVIEIAAGLSGRGWRLCERHENLVYVETDLPDMAALKREKLSAAGLLNARHRVQELDALAKAGPRSLGAVAASLDPDKGIAIITEGLMNYLPPAAARALWKGIATTLQAFSQGLYLSDVYLGADNRNLAIATFGTALATFVRRPLYFHFETERAVHVSMRQFGFTAAQLHATTDIPEVADLGATGGQRVRVLAAQTRR